MCLWCCRCSTTKFPALVERESGEWPFACCRQVVVRVWKETEARGGKARKQRSSSPSGAELELGVGEDKVEWRKARLGDSTWVVALRRAVFTSWTSLICLITNNQRGWSV